MPRISDRVIEEIKARTDIVEVIGSRVPLKRAGSGFSACCPFHNERTPSFHVNPSHQSYHCFGCGEKGNVFTFLMKHDGMTFPDALKMLAERCNVELELDDDDGRGAIRKRLLELHSQVAAFYHRCLLQTRDAEMARNYLQSRNLDAGVIEKFNIGFAPDAPGAMEKFAERNRFSVDELVAAGILARREGDGYSKARLVHRFRGRLMFPICDSRGQVIAFSGRILEKNDRLAKYVNSPETPIFLKGRTLYALDKAQKAIVNAKNREALVCEGQIDVIRCHASGFATAIAAQGTAFTADHVALLKRYADSAILVFDSDGAGQKAAMRTSRIFLGAGVPVRIATMPDGEDPDSFLSANGHDAFQAVLDAAEEVIPFHIRVLRSGEEDPDSVGAVGRISKSLLETISCSHNAIHEARMLQESASLLKIPEEAFRAELDSYKQTAEYKRRFDSDLERARAEEADAIAEMGPEELARLMNMAESDLPQAAIADPGVEVEGSIPARDLTSPPREQTIICRLMMQDDLPPDLVQFIAAHTRPELFTHPHPLAVARAIIATSRTGRDELLALQQQGANQALLEYIGMLAISPLSIGEEGYTVSAAAKDMILELWRAYLTRQRDSTERVDTAASIKRLAINQSIAKLASWEQGASFIVSELTSRPSAYTPW